MPQPEMIASSTALSEDSTSAPAADSAGKMCSACAGKDVPAVDGLATSRAGALVVRIGVKDGAFTPNTFRVKAGIPVTVVFTGKATGCLASPQFKTLRKKADLSSGTATLRLGALGAGTYPLSCAMGALQGKIVAVHVSTASSPARKSKTASSPARKSAPKPDTKTRPAPSPAVQNVSFDTHSHQTLTVRAKAPVNVTFAPSTTGCAAKITFTTGAFAKTSASGQNLIYHADGLPAGTYKWKCSMTDCCYGTLVVN